MMIDLEVMEAIEKDRESHRSTSYKCLVADSTSQWGR